MESTSQDRNLPASERKLKQARDDGQVARSTDISHLAVLGAGALATVALAPVFYERLTLNLGRQLTFDSTAVLDPQSMLVRLVEMMSPALLLCIGLAACVLVAAVAATLLSGGWVASLKPVLPDLTRLNPLTGLSGLFSKKKLAEIAKMTVVTAALMTIAALYLRSSLGEMASLSLQPSRSALQFLLDWMVIGAGMLLLVILVVGLIDLPLQGFLHRASLKMSRQEVMDENKETEGDPKLKGRRRNKQRELAQRNSIRAVPKADFVLMNPTHYAVALQYDEKTMQAPRVISKGADLLAMKIKDIAKANSIPVLQSPKLARALYAHAELDREIPSALFAAVAQVLVYVYQLKAALRGAAPMPGELAQPEVPHELDPLSPQARTART